MDLFGELIAGADRVADVIGEGGPLGGRGSRWLGIAEYNAAVSPPKFPPIPASVPAPASQASRFSAQR